MWLWCNLQCDYVVRLCIFCGTKSHCKSHQSSAGTFSKIFPFWVALSLRMGTIENDEISLILWYCVTQVSSKVALVWTGPKICFTLHYEGIIYNNVNNVIPIWILEAMLMCTVINYYNPLFCFIRSSCLHFDTRAFVFAYNAGKSSSSVEPLWLVRLSLFC